MRVGIHIARQHTVLGTVDNLVKLGSTELFVDFSGWANLQNEAIGSHNNRVTLLDGHIRTLLHALVGLLGVTDLHQLLDILEPKLVVLLHNYWPYSASH